MNISVFVFTCILVHWYIQTYSYNKCIFIDLSNLCAYIHNNACPVQCSASMSM